MNLLLKNSEIITLNQNNDVLKDCSLGISNGVIDYLGPYSREIENRYGHIIDCKGKTVLPGLINCHGHAAMTMFRNYADDLKLMDWLFNKIFPLEDKLTDEIVYWGTNLAILEMLKSGTTTFTDMYFFMDSAAKAAGESGIRACLSRGLVGDSDGNGINEKFKEALEFYKSHNNSFNGRIKVNLGPHAIYTCSVPYLKQIAAKSEEMNIPIQIHLSETRDEVDDCIKAHGVSPVKLLEDTGILKSTTIAAHCVVIDDEDIEILFKNKVNAVHNPGSNLKLASGISPVAKMISKGINVCLGTDGAASNNNLDMFEEIRTATYVQKVYTADPTALPVDEVLRMATVNGGRALGFEKLGTIEMGMKADVIVLNTQRPYYYPKYNTKAAIVYSANSSDVDTVIIDGKIVMKNNNILTLDEERIFYEVDRLSKQLTAGM